MNKTAIINYPGVLRAFNRIDAFPNDKEKSNLMSFLNELIDRNIQKCLNEIELTSDSSNMTLNVTQKQLDKLLNALDEKNVILYEGISNKEALIITQKKK